MASDGPLTRRVIEYSETLAQLVPSVRTPHDLAPIAEFVAVDEFERVGTFMEVHDWTRYAEMLVGWASHIERFETTVHRISEIGNLVYYEIEERHHVGSSATVLNSLTVFDFDDHGKIRRLDVFMQKSP